MKSLALIGAKGGTFKTASVAALAHVLAATDLRVAMLDLDPQGDLTTRSGHRRVVDPLQAEPVPVAFEGERSLPLWLMRGGRAMEAADMDSVRRHIERAQAELDPDVLVIDTPPALGPATRAAASVASYVIIPSEPGKESLMRAHDVIDMIRQTGNEPLIRIVLTRVHVVMNAYRWMVREVDELYPGLRAASIIPTEAAALESGIFDRPVTVSAPRSKAALAYCDVAADVIGQLDLKPRVVEVGS